jgi:hypothetical protein
VQRTGALEKRGHLCSDVKSDKSHKESLEMYKLKWVFHGKACLGHIHVSPSQPIPSYPSFIHPFTSYSIIWSPVRSFINEWANPPTYPTLSVHPASFHPFAMCPPIRSPISVSILFSCCFFGLHELIPSCVPGPGLLPLRFQENVYL